MLSRPPLPACWVERASLPSYIHKSPAGVCCAPAQTLRCALQKAWKPGLLHAPGLMTGATTAIHNLFVGREDAPGQAPAEDHPSQTASDDVRLSPVHRSSCDCAVWLPRI